MPGRVAGNGQHIEAKLELGNVDRLVVGNRAIDGGNVFVCRAIDWNLTVMGQSADAAGVVVVVVGDQNGGQIELVLAQKGEHGHRVAGIDHDGVVGIAQGPDVVVPKGRDRADVNRVIHWHYDSMTERMSSFQAWFSGVDGSYLREREQALHDWTVSNLFGFHGVQIGLSCTDFLRSSRIKHLLHVDAVQTGGLLADPEHLPFANQSVDLLLLPHVLEFSTHPHQILREAERVLIAEGSLVLTGFNPWGLWRAWYWYKRSRGEFDWQGHFISLQRLRDWLSLLGCDMVSVHMCCYAPPVANAAWVRWFEGLEAVGHHWWSMAGSIYFVHAVKRVHGMHLIMPAWQEESRRLGKVLSPASRSMGP